MHNESEYLKFGIPMEELGRYILNPPQYYSSCILLVATVRTCLWQVPR
jgi:hypothetical protein